MKNAHIAFFGYPTYPHVGPTFPVTAVLVRRGYRVTYVASDKFASRISALGAELVLCPPAATLADFKERGQSALLHHAARSLEETTGFYERDRPALIIYDHVALAGRILAHRWGIPVIQASPMFVQDRRAIAGRTEFAAFFQSMLSFSQMAEDFLDRQGVGGQGWLFHREKLNLHFFPKVLQPNAEMVDESCFFAGRCAGEQPYYGDWKRNSADDRPIVLVSTSTLYVQGSEHFKMCIEALSGLDWHVILSIGDSGDSEALSPLPPHFEIVQHTSHVKILPHVSLFICLGGIVTTSEAAYHGVPLIVTTHGSSELEYQAENIVRLGIGVHLTKADTNVENLRRAVIQVSENATILNKVERIKQIVRRDSGAEEVANRIEDYLECS